MKGRAIRAANGSKRCNQHALDDREATVILRHRLLREKPCGKYKCPHFISPAAAHDLVASLQITATPEAEKMLAEVMENFGLELLCGMQPRKLSSHRLRALVAKARLR